MKAKKTTKRLRKSKKLESTKPLSTGKVSVGDLQISKVVDKSSAVLF
ncbi:MAG TPA: hypothetical protein VLY23_18180 [Candidatus Acidoferrum sp.]|nr:hypothetical protein [Candidatus Acidoferrum sp.]